MAKLHEPIAGFKPLAYPQGDITQFFGENPALYAQFGWKGHNGWDITRAYGTPILCVQSGKVADAKEDSGGNGKHVRIFGADGEWIYGHLSRIDVSIGQHVEAGQQIGLMGNSGFVVSDATAGGYWKYNPYAGTHLHLTHYPAKLWNGEPTWDTSYPSGDRAIRLFPNNGYNGAVDFKAEDFEGKAAIDEQLASDRIAALAAQMSATGDTKAATILFAIVQVLKAWGN